MIKKILESQISEAISNLYNYKAVSIQLQKTRSEFEGDFTVVVFPLLKITKQNPEKTAEEIGSYLIQTISFISKYNVVKGFLNLSISANFWIDKFYEIYSEENFGITKAEKNSPVFLVEFSSPNTNKPIHLGHLRNNFLGFSLAKILSANGKKVKKVQIINDRGIHICKSMVAWLEFGNGETPKSSGIKGDHLVGKYYVKFDEQYRKEVSALIKQGSNEEEAKKASDILKKAQQMLVKWEDGDSKIIDLWKTMNGWVYEGFDITYKNIGVDFDKNYYESDTYLLGKEIVDIGIKKNVFYKKEDGSVWIDLSDEGLDEKVILRADGTTVYMTQDIGTALQRQQDFSFSNMIYTVANEQDYHFKVLFLILKKLGYSWANNCYHLSYGMVDLPTGKMKSREGTVVDADEFLNEMINTAKSISKELGKLEDMSAKKAEELYSTIGLGALKYFMLKVDPKKRMLFDPNESVDFNGNTGPFIQYTFARIQSLLRNHSAAFTLPKNISLNSKERDILKCLLDFPDIINEAASTYSPAVVANYVYNLVKSFNHYYQHTPILKADGEDLIRFRLALSKKVGEVIKNAMDLLGISVPDRM